MSRIESSINPESQLRDEADLQDHEIDLKKRELLVIGDVKEGNLISLRRINNTQLFMRQFHENKVKKIIGRVRLEDEVVYKHGIGDKDIKIKPQGLKEGGLRSFKVSVPKGFKVFSAI